MITVCIVDDEQAGISLISEYLDPLVYQIMGIATNGNDAVNLLNFHKPDLIFLDVQMPEMDGFEVLTQIEEIPKVIFSTAYDKYALKAFEVHAVDYLLKPYTKERFEIALEKSKKTDNIKPLAEEILHLKEPFPSRILVQNGTKLISLDVNAIIRIEANGDYSNLFCAHGKYLSNYGISKIENKLDQSKFIRVHRSAIINLNFVKEVNKLGNGYDITLQNNDLVRVSRGYQENLRKFFF